MNIVEMKLLEKKKKTQTKAMELTFRTRPFFVRRNNKSKIVSQEYGINKKLRTLDKK